MKWKSGLSEETAEHYNSPARGWYQIYSFAATDVIDEDELQWSLDSTETVALVLIDIGMYRQTDLDEAGLKNIRRILAFFAEAQKDMVLRVTYDREGKGLEKEPALFEQVLTHIKQLAPLIREYAQAILTVQGLLIGSWGEMHGSRFLQEERLWELADTFFDSVGGGCKVAVRRPMFWRALSLQGEEEAYRKKERYEGELGLFDDALFSTPSHMGTFAEIKNLHAGWQEAWSREEELDFEKWLGEYVPNGGETVCPTDDSWLKTVCTPKLVIQVLRSMHLTYLNCAYDRKLLDQWVDIPCEQTGIWKDLSLYDYVGRHLGYRFLVTEAEVRKGELTITIQNSGFAPIYRKTRLLLLAESERKRISKKYLLPFDVKDVRSGSKTQLKALLPSALCENSMLPVKLYLCLEQEEDGRRIAFANEGGENGIVYLGDLH